MRALVLAAGFGTRLRPLTDHIPKALVPVCGIPLLERNLRILYDHSINDLAINAHYLPDQLFTFREQCSLPFRIFHELPSIRGTGGALHFAREYLSVDDTFLIANVDIVSNLDWSGIISIFEKSSSICTLIAAPPRRDGTIYYDTVSHDYCGTSREANADCIAAGADFMGIALYRREFLSCVNDEDFSILPVWRRAQERGYSVTVHIEPDVTWYDTGTPEALAQVHVDVLDRKYSLVLPEHMHIDPVRKIAHHKDLTEAMVASLRKYAWIDADSIPETSTIAHSVVYKHGIVPEHAVIENQILTPWGGIPFHE